MAFAGCRLFHSLAASIGQPGSPDVVQLLHHPLPHVIWNIHAATCTRRSKAGSKRAAGCCAGVKVRAVAKYMYVCMHLCTYLCIYVCMYV